MAAPAPSRSGTDARARTLPSCRPSNSRDLHRLWGRKPTTRIPERERGQQALQQGWVGRSRHAVDAAMGGRCPSEGRAAQRVVKFCFGVVPRESASVKIFRHGAPGGVGRPAGGVRQWPPPNSSRRQASAVYRKAGRESLELISAQPTYRRNILGSVSRYQSNFRRPSWDLVAGHCFGYLGCHSR
jgi:hypothetical protein